MRKNALIAAVVAVFCGTVALCLPPQTAACGAFNADTGNLFLPAVDIGDGYTAWARLRYREGTEPLVFVLEAYGIVEGGVLETKAVFDTKTGGLKIPFVLVFSAISGETATAQAEFILKPGTDPALFETKDVRDLKIKDNGTLKYFGYGFSAVDGIGSGNYIAKVADHSNLIHVGSGSVAADIAKIGQAAARGAKSIVVLTGAFFDFGFDDDGRLVSVSLAPDYRERWERYAAAVAPYASDIYGFFILDEPYWGAICIGMPLSEMKSMLEEAAAAVKSRFPGAKIVGTIAITAGDLRKDSLWGYPVPENALEEYAFPANYDVIAVYYYYSQWLGQAYGDLDGFFEIYHRRLSDYLRYRQPHQELILVPGAFYGAANPIPEEELSVLADYYFFLAATEPSPIGIIPFLYPSVGNMVGVEDMALVKKKYEEIGKRVTGKRKAGTIFSFFSRP